MAVASESAVDERSVNVAGLETPVRVQLAGPVSGPPLVYLHGSNGACWPPGLQALAKTYRVYVPEHPGFGETERPEWIETVRDLALYYLDLFDALGLSSVNLVGQSLGGWIAADLASMCSHDLRRLVLVGAAGLLLEGERRLDQFALSPEAMVRALYHDQSLAEKALAEPSTEQQIRLRVRNGNMTARLGWSPYMADPSLRGRLRRIRIPTLLVWGTRDRIVPLTHAHAYAASIPHARLALIEGSGHLPAVEQAAEFTRVVGTFLAVGEGE